MAFAELPENPDIENLKKQAKTLLKAVRAGNQQALERVGPYFGAPGKIGLQYAQLVIAREYGFSSWPSLRSGVARGSAGQSGDQLANRFLDLVCLVYSPVSDFGPGRFEQAKALLEQRPEIRAENIYTAAAIGDARAVGHWLDQDPGLISRKGGFFHWEPLMYAAYARLPGASTLASGLFLLERGADPNAHYMWGGQYKFTALTGVFGQGEGGPVNQPEHPDHMVFARALLEAGADPNDSQSAYNRCFEPDDSWLELLLEFGLSGFDGNNWLLKEGEEMLPNPSQTMHFHLIQALHRGYVERAKLLIDHGVDLNKPDDTYDTLTKDKTPYEAALLLGQEEVANYLLAAGAKQTELAAVEAFQAACMRGDAGAARNLLAADSDLADRVKPRHREMLCDAVKQSNRPALKAMIDLEFELNDATGRTPLHEAAYRGDLEMARLLLAAGADSTLRDAQYFSPPIGHAQHAEQEEMIALLDTAPMDIFTAAARGNLEQIRTHLLQDPESLELHFGQIRPQGGDPLDHDWTTPLAFAVLNGQAAAVSLLLDHSADASINNGAGRSILTLAEERGDAAIVAALKQALAG